MGRALSGSRRNMGPFGIEVLAVRDGCGHTRARRRCSPADGEATQAQWGWACVGHVQTNKGGMAGVGHVMSNKGGIAIALEVWDTSIVFVSTTLPPSPPPGTRTQSAS